MDLGVEKIVKYFEESEMRQGEELPDEAIDYLFEFSRWPMWTVIWTHYTWWTK